MNNNIFFWKVFGKRIVISYFLTATLFLCCILRITVICSKDYTSVAINQNYYKLKLSNLRGTIYDCNLIPLTNNTLKTVAAVSSTPRAITAISSVLEGNNLIDALNKLKRGKPIVCEVENEINCDGIYCTEIYTTQNLLACHTVGYCDNEGKGVMGIEKSYEEILNNDNKSVYLLYECDGKGNILEGVSPTFEYDKSIINNGVVTTLDVNFQKIAEEYSDFTKKGAIIIADAKTGKIKASVSRPNIDFNDLEGSLNDENLPFLNRTINAYNVGSVFKPCVAATGIENNLKDFIYNCTGSFEIIDRIFKCHEQNGHKNLNLKSAIANSCNTYFYNYAIKIGANKILKMSNNLRFGKSIELCDGIKTSKGNLPNFESLNNPAQLANFSIGQGELLISPISILTLYCAIANKGVYYNPKLVEGTYFDGKLIKEEKESPTRVMKEETANILKEYLKEVIDSGTGTEAKPLFVSAAGKTATAQTGKFENGQEICSGWFCGMFPYEDPKYIAIIFSENINLQKKSCSKIFSEIADSISNNFM